MNIFLIILLILFIVFSLILLFSINIKVIYNTMTDNLVKCDIKFMLFSFNLFSHNLKEDSRDDVKMLKKNDECVKKLSSKKRKKSNKIVKKIKSFDMSELFSCVCKLISGLASGIKKLLKKIIIYDLNLYISVSGDDAADVGIKYGRVNAEVYGLYMALTHIFNIKNVDINISPNFFGGDSKIYFKINAKIRIVTLFVISIIMLYKLGFLIYKQYRNN